MKLSYITETSLTEKEIIALSINLVSEYAIKHNRLVGFGHYDLTKCLKILKNVCSLHGPHVHYTRSYTRVEPFFNVIMNYLTSH